jgi:Domain of unknown function (DUF4124)
MRIGKPTYPTVVLAALCAVAAQVAFAAAPKKNTKAQDDTVYKWVDEKGVVHYGDTVPPQYAKTERRVLNEQGVEVGRLEAQKSEAQATAEENARRASASARQRDQILLTTYVSEQQIEQLRDTRLDLIEGQVKVTTLYLGSLTEKLERLHTQSQFFKPYNSNAGAGPMPDQLAADLVRTINEIRAQERNLERKRKEQSNLREQFSADLDRYRELKTPRRYSE